MLKQLVRSVVYASCWEPLWDCFRDFGAVMCLHSIAPVAPDGIEENQMNRVSPERLDQFLTSAAKKGFTFVSMDEIAETLRSGKKIAKRLAITADDGYRDNFETALPIMMAHNAPFCINLSTGLMEGETIAWWNPLEQFVLAHDSVDIPDGRTFPARTPAEKREAFRQVRWWIQKIPYSELNAALASYFGQSVEALRAASRDSYLPVAELPRYANEPLLTLACHTHSHFACENFTPDAFRNDIQTCLKHLAAAGVRPRHFAYPYGRGISKDSVFADILRELGFQSAAVTITDVLMQGMDPFYIPRLSLSEFPADTQLPYTALAKRTLLGKV